MFNSPTARGCEPDSLTCKRSGDILEVMNSPRHAAATGKPLSLEERRAFIAELAKTASPKVKKGLAMIDLREPTPAERAVAESLVESGKRALARNRKRKAA
jgi:hypothetical protein